MMFKYFLPEREFTFRELDVISAKVEGLWTWPTAAVLWLVDNGFEVRNVETFDYKEFAQKGGDYLLSHFGENVGQAQIDHSDIPQEIKLAKLFNQKIVSEMRIPEISDLWSCLDEGYLPGCNVNSHGLIGMDGYSGHFVVIIGYDEDSLLLHDPGLPARQNLRVSNEVFEQAWAYPDRAAKNYFAIKLQS
jgi:hypothetical protein